MIGTPPSGKVVLDCRWLAFTGAGRVVELLIRGLSQRPSRYQWILWGPAAIESYSWPGAETAITPSAPNAWRGQRDWLRIPPADLVVFMHQQRPLRRVPALTTILDLTPIQYPTGRLDRWAKTRFLKQAASSSRQVLTISDFSKRCIESQLGVAPDRITLINLPADDELAARVLARREHSGTEPVALYLGLFLPHKNLPRLIAAFGKTSFRENGGRLLLVGGKAGAPNLEASLTPEQRSYVEIQPRCSQNEVEELLASSSFLVQPSLVEGFGLPVWEALACGLPVCASDGGALPEITRGLVDHFPAASETAMSSAIDDCAAKSATMTLGDRRALSAQLIASAPTLLEFADQFEAIIDQHLSAAVR